MPLQRPRLDVDNTLVCSIHRSKSSNSCKIYHNRQKTNLFTNLIILKLTENSIRQQLPLSNDPHRLLHCLLVLVRQNQVRTALQHVQLLLSSCHCSRLEVLRILQVKTTKRRLFYQVILMFINTFKFLRDPIHLYSDLSPLSHLLGRSYIRQHRTSSRIRKFTGFFIQFVYLSLPLT